MPDMSPQISLIFMIFYPPNHHPPFSHLPAAYYHLLPTLPHVADWDAAVIQAQQAGRTVMADKVHPDAEGQQLLAQVIDQAVASCSGSSPAS